MKHLLPLAALASLGSAPAWAGDCPDLTALQRAAGFVTWQGALQLGAIGLGAAGALIFCGGLVRRFLQQTGLIEVLLWLLALGSLMAGAVVPEALRLWPVLFGCLMLPGAVGFSVHLRKIAFTFPQAALAFGCAWSAVALLSNEPAVGFLAIGAWLAWVGLRLAVGPFCYVMGFEDRAALPRATAAGALLVGAFLVLEALGATGGPVAVFRAGALWLGSFSWFLGVLIVSVKWYRHGHYARRQALAVASLGLGLSLGLLMGVRELSTMATAFLLFYVLGKVAEIPAHGRIGFGLKLLGAGGLLAGLWFLSGAAQTWLMPVLAAAR